MEVITCPNCNVDVDVQELRRNNLVCPTCGHDLSEAAEAEESDLAGGEEWEEEEELDEEEEEDEEYDEDEDEDEDQW